MGFSHVIPELVKKIEKNNVKKIKIFSPTHKRSFCHVDDAIDQILGLSFSKHVYNDTFNIGNSNEETKIFAVVLADTTAAELGLQETPAKKLTFLKTVLDDYVVLTR